MLRMGFGFGPGPSAATCFQQTLQHPEALGCAPELELTQRGMKHKGIPEHKATLHRGEHPNQSVLSNECSIPQPEQWQRQLLPLI